LSIPVEESSSTGEYVLIGKLTQPYYQGMFQETMLILKSGGGAVYTNSLITNPRQGGMSPSTRYTGNWSEVVPGTKYSVTMTNFRGMQTVQVISGARAKWRWHMDLEFKVGPTGLKVSNQSHWPTVVAVDPGSRAEQLGVKVGWRVVKVAQDGFSEDWRNSCSQRSCFVGLQYGEPWFADQTLLVRFGLDDQHGYDEVRMGSTQLKKVSNPDAPAFWGTDDD
jgi:hypothetical protein